mmetsp:Transcript_37264/g.85996  ORF Transcript_37264/g.85996 Transcript_37264/m.85996 type:complete len:481 (+) Transcript_37264:81-1523(+)
MAINRLCSALALATYAAGQLVFEPPVDVDRLMQELKSEGLFSASEGEQVSADIVSPSICDPSVKQHAGYVNVGASTNYFFWLFESRGDPAKDPLVMWLNGGPGCSSLLGLFTENGPCTVDKDSKTTKLNKNSWNAHANVIYVDQPSATGFSTGLPTTHDEQGVASNMYKFMQGFYKALPQYASRDFYLFGESYAGHYVPAISHFFWQQSKSMSGFKVPLKGVGIGNGLVDPEEQYKWYPQMAKDGGKAEGGTLEKGVITNFLTQAAMKAATVPCVSLIKSCNSGTNSSACTAAYAICNYGELIPYQTTGYNPYDMRIKCAVPPLCYDMSQVEGFLNSADVQKQLGISGKKWESCNRIVNMAFQGDWMKTYQQMLPDMLADGIKVLVYAGDVDYICNWLGNKKWALAMDWPHKDEFGKAADADYMVDGKAAGKVRTSNGFHFMQIFQAGHMVPMDQPEVAFQMLDDFISGKISMTEDSIVV